jgi:nitroreductase
VTSSVAELSPPLPEHVDSILGAARLAPSHDNQQPWRFLVEGDAISFFVDQDRDRSPGCDGGRMARIGVGAAVECALVRAGRLGASVRFQPPRPGALVTITVSDAKRQVEGDKALMRRTTNRHLYDGRAVDEATFKWLQEATPPLESARTHWFGRERVRTLGPLVEEGEAILFADARLRSAALRAVHFDARDREEVTHGLSVGSLELSGAERVNLDALRQTPQDRLAAMGAFQKMGARARRQIESASGVCVIATGGADAFADVAVGRSMLRAWLALTRRGLAAQPMASLPALEAALEANPGGLAEADRARAATLALRAAIPSIEKGARIALLLRFGWAAAPTASVRRLALEESVATSESGMIHVAGATEGAAQ